MIIYLGAFHILLGVISLIIPLIYLEFGRPKDFIKAGLNLIIGMILIIKNKVFESSYPIIHLLFAILIFFYLVEIFTNRWNQLTNQEKNRLKTLGEFNKNISKISQAISLGVNNFLNSFNIIKFDTNNENLNKKKWVRTEENDNIKS